jgi:hypothetical protein
LRIRTNNYLGFVVKFSRPLFVTAAWTLPGENSMRTNTESEHEPALEEQKGYVGEALSIKLTFFYHGVLDGGAGDSAELVDEGTRIRHLITHFIEIKLKEELADSWSVKTTVERMLS